MKRISGVVFLFFLVSCSERGPATYNTVDEYINGIVKCLEDNDIEKYASIIMTYEESVELQNMVYQDLLNGGNIKDENDPLAISYHQVNEVVVKIKEELELIMLRRKRKRRKIALTSPCGSILKRARWN